MSHNELVNGIFKPEKLNLIREGIQGRKKVSAQRVGIYETSAENMTGPRARPLSLTVPRAERQSLANRMASIDL